jgi:hypothetical protein
MWPRSIDLMARHEGLSSGGVLVRFVFPRVRMINLLRAKQHRSHVISFLLLGLCPLAGCSSNTASDSTDTGPGASVTRNKKLQELKTKAKAKADATK